MSAPGAERYTDLDLRVDPTLIGHAIQYCQRILECPDFGEYEGWAELRDWWLAEQERLTAPPIEPDTEAALAEWERD